MSFSRFEFTKTWLDPEAFPAYEPDEGQVRADLQSLHDEAKEGINRLIDALNDVSAAAQLPFAPVPGLEAETVQAAIEQVFGAVSDAAAAKIVDGSVTKQKLAAELLRRAYGGRVWMSLNAPTAADDPDHDFPVGQLWLRPAMSVDDLSHEEWELDGGVLRQEEGTVFVSNGTRDYLKAVQRIAAAGEPGDHVLIRLLCEGSEEIRELRLFINGKEVEPEEDGLYDAFLDDAGALELAILGQMDYAMADASLRLDALRVVDLDALERQNPDCEPCEDWEQELCREDGDIPMVLWIQTAGGRWEQIGFDRVPVSHGGTGLAQVGEGALLCGTGTDRLAALPPVEGGLVQWSGGKPAAVMPDALAEAAGYLRARSGTYTGTGGNADRTVELSVTPQMLLLWAADGSTDTVVLANGGRSGATYMVDIGAAFPYRAWVELQGSELRFSNERTGNGADRMVSGYMNAEGVAYHWLAVY